MKPLTVVVPAYNVQTYITQCIESVLNQPAAASLIDLVIVIDGATDNTLAVVESIAPRFAGSMRVIVQNNQGLSAARNTGIALASTEYVAFLDGDDVWLEDYLSNVLPVIERKRPDIVEHDAIRIDESGNTLGALKISSAPDGTTIMVSREAFLTKFLCFAWARVYRTSLVRAHPYPLGRRFEDTATTPWHYWNSTRIVSLGRPLVGYRQRSNSILATPRKMDIDDITRTTAEAAAMFTETGAEYWQRVTHRSFQQACSRIAQLPVHTWPSSLRTSRAAAVGVPPPSGFTRWLQASAPLIYVALLRVKRALERSGWSMCLWR